MTDNHPVFDFLVPEKPYTELVRRVILGYAEDKLSLKLPIRPTGYAYFTYSRYPEDTTLNYSNKSVHTSEKLGFANQILKEQPYFEIDGRFLQIGIELYPHIPYQLFDLSGEQLLNRVHMLSTTDVEIKNLQVKLDNIEHPARVATAMQDFLLDKMQRVDGSRIMVAILDDIYSKNGHVRISDLAERHHISERHLQRIFKEQIGLSPKQYAMVIQFNHVQQKLLSGEVSFETYHDQAHFTKICKAITGHTPKELMKLENKFLSSYLK